MGKNCVEYGEGHRVIYLFTRRDSLPTRLMMVLELSVPSSSMLILGDKITLFAQAH